MNPIQRAEPLVNQVYKYLRDEILTGGLAAGEKIIETRLAVDLKVSRSPVREAIRLLTMEQLLIERDGDIRVFEPTFQDYFELYDVRLALEPAVARQAAERTTTGQLGRIRMNLSETELCLKDLDLDMKQLITLNAEFHQLIRNISGNSRFIHILDSISPVIEYYGRLVLNINKKKTNILAEHTAIYQALEVGDGERTERCMYDHIIKDLKAVKSETNDPSILSRGGRMEEFAVEKQNS